MMSPVMELTDILEQEFSLYEDIAALEDAKSESIMARDGKVLEEISVEQEKIAAHIARLEEKRMKVLEAYCQEESFLKSAEKIRLRDIASNMDMPAAERLMHYGTELKKIIYRIKKLQETNNRLIKDNIDFFDILLSGLKNTAAMQTGYSQKGETQEVKSNPVLFNQTV